MVYLVEVILIGYLGYQRRAYPSSCWCLRLCDWPSYQGRRQMDVGHLMLNLIAAYVAFAIGVAIRRMTNPVRTSDAPLDRRPLPHARRRYVTVGGVQWQ